jgi:hypothetical protein
LPDRRDALSRLRVDFHIEDGEPITWICSRFDHAGECTSIVSGACEPFGTGRDFYNAVDGLLDQQLTLW